MKTMHFERPDGAHLTLLASQIIGIESVKNAKGEPVVHVHTKAGADFLVVGDYGLLQSEWLAIITKNYPLLKEIKADKKAKKSKKEKAAK